MTDEAPFRIVEVVAGSGIEAVADLFRAYAASLPVDLAYQGFAAELAGLPGLYGPPGGALLLARDAAGAPIGCAALRPLGAGGACEMKRLYAAPSCYGTGLGRALVERLVVEARRLGYGEMRLDTLPTMADAQALYGRMGFEPMAPYYDTPVAGTVFLRLRL